MRTRPTSRILALLVGILGAGVGCDGGSPTDPAVPVSLPAHFRIVGEASSVTPDGGSVSCTMDLEFELQLPPRVSPGRFEYDGVHGGHLQRTVLDSTGSGISLAPDVFGAVAARSTIPDRLEILVPANVDADGRFWRELSRLEGRLAESTAVGTWRCAPFDTTEGWIDGEHTAAGTWRMSPVTFDG